jgi:hypothetical protein
MFTSSLFSSRSLRPRSSWILVCALLLSVHAAGQFEVRGTFLAQYGSSPLSIAVGDFNHDGILDLAVVSYCCGPTGVSILLGRGDGTFEPSITYPAGDQPFSVVAADFNHDGNLDLAVANSLSNYVSILLGNGDGTFRPGPQNPPLVQPAVFVAVGDFNADGIPDLVTIEDNGYCHCISVLLGNGDGTFQDAIVTQPSFVVQAIGIGDFNHDGKLDLATAGTFGFSSSVNILLGNGDGTFQYGASYPGGTLPANIAVTDLNGDHRPDLAISNSEGGSISVLLGDGDGTFQPPVDYPTAFPSWVAVGDVNGDHIPDLIAANFDFSSGVSVLLGNGDGTFRPGVFYAGGIETSYVALGDFNGDRQADLAAADYLYGTVRIMLNTGIVSFLPTEPMNFKKQMVGTTSKRKSVTLTNAGAIELKIASMKVTGAFSMTSTCGKTVAPGASCTITATFTPTRKGEALGTVTIIDSASTRPQVIELMGTGT